eukprot:scaffold108262_cov33-Tisochrysis_lutea.AAC.3
MRWSVTAGSSSGPIPTRSCAHRGAFPCRGQFRFHLRETVSQTVGTTRVEKIRPMSSGCHRATLPGIRTATAIQTQSGESLSLRRRSSSCIKAVAETLVSHPAPKPPPTLAPELDAAGPINNEAPGDCSLALRWRFDASSAERYASRARAFVMGLPPDALGETPAPCALVRNGRGVGPGVRCAVGVVEAAGAAAGAADGAGGGEVCGRVRCQRCAMAAAAKTSSMAAVPCAAMSARIDASEKAGEWEDSTRGASHVGPSCMPSAAASQSAAIARRSAPSVRLNTSPS